MNFSNDLETPKDVELRVVMFSNDDRTNALLYRPKTNSGIRQRDPAIISLHGSEQHALRGINLWLAPFLASKGYIVACPNKRNSGKLFSSSLFDWCEEDINDVASMLQRETGIAKFVLIGHSMGAAEAIFYQGKTRDERIVGLVLLGPPLWFQDVLNPDSLKLAEDHVNDEKNFFIEFGDGSPVTAKHYVSYWSENSNADTRKWIDKVTVPILIIGHSLKLIEICSAETAEKLSKMATNSPSIDCKIIEGATHSFQGHYDETSRAILNWLEKQKCEDKSH